MALKGDVKFKGKLTPGLKNDKMNFVKFSYEQSKVTLMGSFCPKHI